MACLEDIKKQFPELKDQEARRLVTTLQDLKTRYSDNLAEYNRQAKTLVQEAELSKLLQLKAKVNDVVKLQRNVKHILQPGFEGNKVEGILSMLEGTSRKVSNQKHTVEGIYSSLNARFQQQFLNELNAVDFEGEFGTGLFDKEIIKEVFNRSKPDYTPNKVKGIRQVADVIVRFNQLLIKVQQDAGSTIRYKAGYLFQQTHDPDRILDNVDSWVEFTVPKLDLIKSFGTDDIKVAKARLHAMAKDLNNIGGGSNQFMGGTREFEFRDGDAFFEYNEGYGHRTLLEGITSSIDNSSKKAALTTIFGNKPLQNLEKLKEIARDIEGDANFDKDLRKVEDAIALYSGVGNTFRNVDSALAKSYKVVAGIKTQQNYSKLGGTGFTSLNDLSNTMMTLRIADGRNVMSAFTDTVFSFVMSVRPGQRRELAELLTIGMEDMTREVFENIGSTKYSPGVGSKIMNAWMTVNLTKPVTNINRSSAMRLHLKSVTNNILSKTPNEFQLQTREAIGLTAKDINTLRDLAKDGDEISPRLVLDSNLDDKTKLNLSSRLGSYYNDVVSSSSPIAGNKQFRKLGRSRQKDDLVRLAAEALTQYKGTLFKSAQTADEFVRAHHPEGKLDLRNWNVVKSGSQFLFAAGIVGLMIDELKTFVLGKERKPVTAARYGKAIMDSGALGLWADMAVELSTESRGRSPSPGIGLVRDIKRYIESPTTRNRSAAENAWKVLRNQMPGQNLWLIKAIENRTIKEGSYRSKRGKY